MENNKSIKENQEIMVCFMSEISVIMPVYNVEKYLKQCLDSICNQTFRDIEIICVDDGSTDSSPDILKQYAEKDSRIKVITQENRGLGGARNTGFKYATGNYVYFIDSDDYLDLNALEKLHDNAVSNQSDIVLFKFKTVDDDSRVHRKRLGFRIDDIFGDVNYNKFTFTYMEAKKHVMNSAFSACLKLYKKAFVDEINFSFPENLHFEDVPVHVRVMIEAESISFVPRSFYSYRSNPDSIMNLTANSFDIFTVIDMVEDYLVKNGHYDELENEFIFFKIAQILVYLKKDGSQEYFAKAKGEFEKITIKDKKTLKKYAIVGYNRVLESRDFDDYNSKLRLDKSKKTKTPFKKFINIFKNIKK